MSCTEKAAIHCIGHERLPMHCAVEIPTLVVAGIERLKVDELRVGRHTGGASQIAHAYTHPFRSGSPSLYAEVIDALACARKGKQILDAELERLPHGPRNLEAPDAARRFVPHWYLLRDEVLGKARAREMSAGGHT